VLVWTLVFAACAGAGAYVAAHTNPFPPGVQDPGSRSASSSAPAPAARSIVVVIEVASRHELHVGGACTSAWTLQLRIDVTPEGSASGRGDASLSGQASCPFATAQVQARSVPLFAQGHMEAGRLLLALREDGEPRPPGGGDLGGFLETIPKLRLRVVVDGQTGIVTVSKADGDLGRFVARYRATASCAAGC
jgi:hypothetical protein